MADSKNTIEFILKLQLQGQELAGALRAAVANVGTEMQGLADKSNATADIMDAALGNVAKEAQRLSQQAAGLGAAFADIGVKVPPRLLTLIPPIVATDKALQQTVATARTLPAAMVGIGAAATTALDVASDAATGFWAALGGPIGVIYELVRPLFDFFLEKGQEILSFLNPLTLTGAVTDTLGIVGGTAGVKGILDAADAVQTYKNRLAAVLGDQEKANRLFGEFHDYSVQVGIDVSKLVDTFEVLGGLNVKAPEKVTEFLAAISGATGTDIGETTQGVQSLASRSLKRLGIDLTRGGGFATLTSGSISKTFTDDEQDIRENLIKLLEEKFPNALEQAQNRFETKVAIFRQLLKQYAEGFGQVLLPAAKDALDSINGFLESHKAEVIAFVATIPDAVKILYDSVGKFFYSGSIVSQFSTLAVSLIEPVAKLIGDLASNGVEFTVAQVRLGVPAIVAVWKLLLAELQAAWEIFADNLIPTLLNSIKHSASAAASAAPRLAAAINILAPGAGSALSAASAIPDLPVTPLSSSAADLGKKLDDIADKFVRDTVPKIKSFNDSTLKVWSDFFVDLGGIGKTLLKWVGGLTAGTSDVATLIGAAYNKNIGNQKGQTGLRTRPGETDASLPPLNPAQRSQIDEIEATNDFDRDKIKLAAEYQKQLQESNALLAHTSDGVKDLFRVQFDLAQQYSNKLNAINDQQKLSRDQYTLLVAEGFDKEIAKAQESYDRQIALIHSLQAAGKITPDESLTLQKKANDDLVDSKQAVYDKQKIADDEYQAAISQGLAKQQATAQLAYDRELAGWKDKLNQQLISQQQFDALQLELTKQKQQKLDELQQQKREAGQGVKILVDKSQGNVHQAALDQAALDADRAREQQKKQFDAGYIDAKQYADALDAIAAEEAQKQREINGSITEGISDQFKKMQQNLATNYAIGAEIAKSLVADMSQAFSEAFSGLVTGTETVGQAFTKMADQILQQIARIAFDQAFTNIFADAFGPGKAGAGILTGIGSLFGANSGGLVPGYARGGVVAGSGPDTDSIHAMLTPGEFVVRRQAVRAPGVLSMLQSINSGNATATAAWRGGVPHYAAGGIVGNTPAPAAAGGGVQILPVLAPSAENAEHLFSDNPNVLLRLMEQHKSKFQSTLEIQRS